MEQPYDIPIDAEEMAEFRQHVYEHAVRADAMSAIYDMTLRTPASIQTAFLDRVRAQLERTLYHTQVFLRMHAYYLERCAALGLTVAYADVIWEQHAPPHFDQALLRVFEDGGKDEGLIDTLILSHVEQHGTEDEGEEKEV